MQGGRPPQPSGTNSPSSHPSLDTAGAQRSKRRCRRSRLVSVSSARCAALRARGGRRPQAGGAAHRSAARAGGARPVPFRTRKLSPRAPRVLRRKSVGGQGAADRWTAPSADPREEAPGETRGPFAIPGRPRSRPRRGPFCALCGRGASNIARRTSSILLNQFLCFLEISLSLSVSVNLIAVILKYGFKYVLDI